MYKNEHTCNSQPRAVVVGNDHYNTLNVVRALGRDGIKTDCVIVSDRTKSFVLDSRYVSDGVILDERTDLTSFLKDRYRRNNCRIPLISTSDRIAESIDMQYNILSETFYLPTAGGRECGIKEAMNKSVQLKVASESGFRVPTSVEIALDGYNADSLSDMRYPCIVKPEQSARGCKNDFRVCRTPKELEKALSGLSKTIGNVLVQEFIPNDRVLLAAGVRTFSGKNIMAGVIDKVKHGSDTHNLGLNSLGQLTRDDSIFEFCSHFLENIDYKGPYSFEALAPVSDTSGNPAPYFIETNLRTDGLLFFYQAGGVNFPSIWIRSCLGLEIGETNLKKEIIGMNEFQYLRNFVSLRSVVTNIRDFMKTDAFSILSSDDPKPFFSKLTKR